jgi:hypothetical protein
VLRGGLAAWTVIVNIIDRRTVDDVLNATTARDCFQFSVQLIFTEKATIGVIRLVTRAV